MLRKFCVEARTLRTLRHPNICYFYDTCLVSGAPVIVLELLSGGTLGQYLGIHSAGSGSTGTSGSTSGSPSAPGAVGPSTTHHVGDWTAIASHELLQLAEDVASGLAYLHAHGVTHRDVKLANVMVQAIDHKHHAKLCDFGISTLLVDSGQQGAAPEQAEASDGAASPQSHGHFLGERHFLSQSIGTPRYVAPEISCLLLRCMTMAALPDGQLHVVNDPRVDVYSFGLLLYEILHGQLVFASVPPLEAMRQAMNGRRPTISLRPPHAHLAPLVEACWHADVTRRPPMETVVEVLTQAPARSG